MAIIQSGTTADLLTVDPVSKAARTTLYDVNGISLSNVDRQAIVPGAESGIQIMAADYKTSRMIRSTASGALHTASEESLIMYDSVEGSAIDTNKWVSTLTTMTIAQSLGQITFNSANSTAANNGSMLVSHRKMPFILRGALVFRSRVKLSLHFTGNLVEMGFGSPTTAIIPSIGDGACWRKDGTGQWIPVLSIAGSEYYGTALSDAAFRTNIGVNDYAIFEIFLEGQRAKFSIADSLGTWITEQYVDLPTNVVAFQSTHLNAFHRNYNVAITTTAVQSFIAGTTILSTDALLAQRPWNTIMSGMSYNALTSPTTYAQLANYANSTAPASATLSNTTAGYTTLGGQFQFAAVAGAETDYALFGFAVPSPYTLYITDVSISLYNTGAASATTGTVFQWAIGVNSSAVSLATGAPYSPMKTTLGQQNLPVGAAIGQAANDIIRTFPTPLSVQPGRFAHIILKMPIGTATASQIFRGTVSVGGYFE